MLYYFDTLRLRSRYDKGVYSSLGDYVNFKSGDIRYIFLSIFIFEIKI